MAGTAPKKKKVVRKVAKKYTFVEFTTDLFEGEFRLPKFPPPLGVLRKIQKGQIAELVDWLVAAGVDSDYLEAVESLEAEELEQFIKDWTDGQLADAPKS